MFSTLMTRRPVNSSWKLFFASAPLLSVVTPPTSPLTSKGAPGRPIGRPSSVSFEPPSSKLDW